MWPTNGNGTASPSSGLNPNPSTIGSCQDQNTPTWADRVRGGVTRNVVGHSRSIPRCGNGGSNNKLPIAPPTNGVVHVLDTQKEKKSSSTDGLHDSDATAGVDHMLQTDCQSEKKEQDKIDSCVKELKGEEEEGGKWETVNNSRNQSRNNSATTVRPEGATQSKAIRNLGSSSSSDGDHVSGGDACKDSQLSSSSESSPCHNESSASPPSQVDLTSQSDDLSLVNTDSDQRLSIEDLASGAAQLLLDDREEEKGDGQGAGFEDESTELPHGTSTLSQGLSQPSDDKVCV